MRPAAMLALFCAATLLLFSDRGTISSNSVNGRPPMHGKPGSGIQGEFGISLAADGLLAAMLMVGLMLSAPASSQLARHFPALRLMGCGLSLWVAAALGCAAAPTFPALLLGRFLVGVAAGPFIALAAPLIDDQAPAGRKSVWLAAFFLTIPTGFAVGFVYGGVVGTALGWRAAFAIEAAAMAPLAAAALLAAPVALRGSGKASAPAPGGPRAALAALAADCRALGASPVCLLTMLALSVYNATLGCFAYFGPKAARTIFSLPSERADLLFGGITVLTGVCGTLAGGLALESLGSSVRNALVLCTAGVGVGCVLVMAGFACARSLLAFAPLFAGGEFGMFLLAAPVNAVFMWTVPPELRPFALSAAEVMQHLLGDIPSPPALGWLQSKLDNWRLSMCVCTSLLVLSTALFGLALVLSGRVASYREVVVVDGPELVDEERSGVPDGEAAHDDDLSQPLLRA